MDGSSLSTTGNPAAIRLANGRRSRGSGSRVPAIAASRRPAQATRGQGSLSPSRVAFLVPRLEVRWETNGGRIGCRPRGRVGFRRTWSDWLATFGFRHDHRIYSHQAIRSPRSHPGPPRTRPFHHYRRRMTPTQRVDRARLVRSQPSRSDLAE